MVEVKITAKELGTLSNEVLKGDLVVKRLRRAGIPVIGVLWPRGAHGGKLTMTCGDGGDLHFTWDGVPAPEEELW